MIYLEKFYISGYDDMPTLFKYTVQIIHRSSFISKNALTKTSNRVSAPIVALTLKFTGFNRSNFTILPKETPLTERTDVSCHNVLLFRCLSVWHLVLCALPCSLYTLKTISFNITFLDTLVIVESSKCTSNNCSCCFSKLGFQYI